MQADLPRRGATTRHARVAARVPRSAAARWAAASSAVALLALLTGCQGTGHPAASAAGSASTSGASTAPAPTLALTPADGATEVPPSTPVDVTVTGGSLGEVTVTDGDGHPVAGAVTPSPDTTGAAVWIPQAPLAYGTRYIVAATTEATGDTAGSTASASFTTVTPGSLSTPSIGPLAGQTVGVALPVRVFFDQPVDDAHKPAVQSRLTVSTSRPTDGVWSWLNDEEVHFRPSDYWPADTDVTVHADLYGVDLGNGAWGQEDREVSFHVGDRHVSVADAAAHTLTVYDGDTVVQTYPMSAGKDTTPTRNGTHVVTESYADMTMNSSTFGLAADAPGGYSAEVHWAVRISDNGEFVHAAPWSVAQQGHSNASHGCINLSPDRARWFFHFSQPGDVVDIEHSVGPPLSAADGDIYDWTIPWDQWRAGSALD